MEYYEKKYKDVLVKAREIHRNENEKRSDMEWLFPELKESENERVKKRILLSLEKDLMATKNSGCDTQDLEQCIAWLEKQGKSSDQIHYWTEEEIEPIINDYLRGVEHYGGMIGRLRCLKPKSLEKHGNYSIKWQKNTLYNKPAMNHSVLMKTIQGIAEGEWQGEHWFQYRWSWTLKDNDVLAWMELSDLDEQDEQKPILDFKASNFYVSKADGKIHDMTYNPADKVEPKFKVGDYIVSDYCMGRVVEITNDAYLLDTEQGIPFSCEHNVHLWTIQDAKDGDVLIDKSHVGECVFIFKEARPSDIKTDVNNPLAIIGYCGINHIGFTSQLSGLGFGDTVNCTYYPATKEQRDLLFQKMKEYGYEWDTEKKELKKKIELQPSAWSEEDEKMANDLIEGFQSQVKVYNLVHTSKEIADWLKSLKNRVQPQVKEWSEEDKEYLAACIDVIDNFYTLSGELKTLTKINVFRIEYAEKLKFWLKSLKDRITWKPNKEQIEALDDALNERGFDYNYLNSLYEQLKKL